jgi:hypothetical protein
MQHDWLYDTPRAQELRELHRVERWWADRDKLPPTPRALVDVMIHLWPQHGRPPSSLRENEIDKKIRADSDVVFERSSLTTALAFVRDGKLPPKRPRRR